MWMYLNMIIFDTYIWSHCGLCGLCFFSIMISFCDCMNKSSVLLYIWRRVRHWKTPGFSFGFGLEPAFAFLTWKVQTLRTYEACRKRVDLPVQPILYHQSAGDCLKRFTKEWKGFHLSGIAPMSFRPSWRAQQINCVSSQLHHIYFFFFSKEDELTLHHCLTSLLQNRLLLFEKKNKQKQNYKWTIWRSRRMNCSVQTLALSLQD